MICPNSWHIKPTDKIATDREYIKKKVSEQFKDYNFDINKQIGYFFSIEFYKDLLKKIIKKYNKSCDWFSTGKV